MKYSAKVREELGEALLDAFPSRDVLASVGVVTLAPCLSDGDAVHNPPVGWSSRSAQAGDQDEPFQVGGAHVLMMVPRRPPSQCVEAMTRA